MYTVLIDSSGRYLKKIAIKTMEGQVLAEEEGDLDVVATLEKLLQEKDIKIAEIYEVIPNLGPGSFTGLKIGVTVANVINWLNGRKTINELDVPDYGAEPNIQLKQF